MHDSESSEKITIKDAAKNLGVSTKTIQRYLAKGFLTKIKEGPRTLLLASELNSLVPGPPELPGKSRAGRHSGQLERLGRDVVSLDRTHYENLLIELGEMRKQSQLHLECAVLVRANEDAIARLSTRLEQLSARVQSLEQGHTAEDVEPPAIIPIVEQPDGEPVMPTPPKPWWQK